MLKRLQPLALLFGLVLLAVLLTRLDLAASWDVLRRADPSLLALALLSFPPEVLFKGWRIKFLAGRLGAKLSLWDATRIYLAGQPLACLTPAKLGDVVRVVGLSKKAHLTTAPALAVHVADKVYDLASLALWASVGLLTLLLDQRHRGPALAALAGILLGGLLVAFFTNRTWVRSVAKPLVEALAPKPLAQELHHHGRQFYDSFPSLLSPSALFPALVQSLGAWTATVVRAVFCAKALAIALPAADVALLLPAVIMVEFLPISIMGFGTREAALFLIFASPALPRESLLSFSLLTVAVGPMLSALLGVPAASAMLNAPKESHDRP
jgi:glycosyltransferase 2 family protein